MEVLRATILSKLPLLLTYVIDLIRYEGPLVSLYLSNNKEYYLYCWCEVYKTYHRWLVFRITHSKLRSYIECESSLKELVINPVDKFHYLLDINNELEIKEVCIIFPEDLPNSYIPDEDSFFNSSLMLNQSITNPNELIHFLGL